MLGGALTVKCHTNRWNNIFQRYRYISFSLHPTFMFLSSRSFASFLSCYSSDYSPDLRDPSDPTRTRPDGIMLAFMRYICHRVLLVFAQYCCLLYIQQEKRRRKKKFLCSTLWNLKIFRQLVYFDASGPKRELKFTSDKSCLLIHQLRKTKFRLIAKGRVRITWGEKK